jgi:hypothetical protein
MGLGRGCEVAPRSGGARNHELCIGTGVRVCACVIVLCECVCVCVCVCVRVVCARVCVFEWACVVVCACVRTSQLLMGKVPTLGVTAPCQTDCATHRARSYVV